MDKSLLAIRHMTQAPSFRLTSVWRVWRRALYQSRATHYGDLVWSILEPILIMLAFGWGLGYFVSEIFEKPYAHYFFPGLLAMTAALVPFGQLAAANYEAFVAHRSLRLFRACPISASEVALGEILWASTKGFTSVLVLALMGVYLGLVNMSALPLLLALLALICWMFASLGLLVSTHQGSGLLYSVTYSSLILMTFIAGVYFPLYPFAPWITDFSMFFPLTHAVAAVRFTTEAAFHPALVLHIGVLLSLFVVLTNWAVARFVHSFEG